MTFAVPLFLLAVLAGIIPVVLHMINRQKVKDLPFPTLRFLRVSVQKTRRRKQIHDVLLMLLRTAVLVLLAVGLAKPTWTNLNSLLGGAQTATAVILDNSASMGLIDHERLRLDTAVRAATQILDELVFGDEVVLLTPCGPAFPDQDKLDRTQDRVRQILDHCRVSYQRADLALKVQQARKILSESDAPNKQIFVITDMQELCWEGEGAKGEGRREKGEGRRAKGEGESVGAGARSGEIQNPKSKIQNLLPEGEGGKIPVILVDCNRTPKLNVAVQKVEVQAAVPVVGLPMKVGVELFNTSPKAQQRHVELLLDGAKEQDSPELSIAPEGRARHEFTFQFQRGGLHRGEVRLVGEDGSKFDDRRFFAIEVDQGIPVAIVKPKRHEIPYLEDTFYVEQALAPGNSGDWAVRASIFTASELVGQSLDKYKVVYCVNLPAPDAETAERLRAYVAEGGNLVWICGDNVLPDAYNQMNQAARAQLLPAPLLGVRTPEPGSGRDSWNVSFLDKQDPVLGQLVEPPSLYQSVLVYQHVRIDAAGTPGARVMARLEEGEPLLVQRKIERGKLLMLGTGAHVGWSNLPLRPIFLPLLVRLTLELAAVQQIHRDVIAGSPLILPLKNETQQVGVEILPPSGETIRLKTEAEQGTRGQVLRYGNTYDIGLYALRLLDASQPSQIVYSVNADPDEASPRKIEREKLEGLLAPAPVVFADNPEDLSGTFAWLREGKSLWEIFLTAVLLALVFETFLANRFSRKQEESQGPQTPPGMRRLGRKAVVGQGFAN